MNARLLVAILMLLMLPTMLAGCGAGGNATSSTPEQISAQATSTMPTITDYSQSSNWLHLPDSTQPTKAVDVFYIYPTAWSKTNPSDPNICNIDNASMHAGAQSAFERQATAFETVGNIYAPYYRQADAAYTLAMAPAERNQVIGSIPLGDALTAFKYYLTHYNQGRPFILASHSQGSNVATLILADYLRQNPEVFNRMIVAYVIGYSVTNEYLQQNRHLRFATGPDDTGVIVSYNTQSPNVLPGVNPVVLPDALAINPITWARDETVATQAQGLGSYMPNHSGVFERVPQYADARVDLQKGVVVCSTAGALDAFVELTGFPRGVYHSFDYPFYYYNIRENAKNRTRRFLTR